MKSCPSFGGEQAELPCHHQVVWRERQTKWHLSPLRKWQVVHSLLRMIRSSHIAILKRQLNFSRKTKPIGHSFFFLSRAIVLKEVYIYNWRILCADCVNTMMFRNTRRRKWKKGRWWRLVKSNYGRASINGLFHFLTANCKSYITWTTYYWTYDLSVQKLSFDTSTSCHMYMYIRPI